MSANRYAAPSGGTGQRAATGDRKVVFKSALDSPFKVPWPYVPLNVQNTALASLVTILTGVADYHIARQTAGRKRKRAKHEKARKEKANLKKKRKVGDEDAGVEAIDVDPEGTGDTVKDLRDDEPARKDLDTDGDGDGDGDGSLPPPPAVFSHLTFGINEVTKRLESQSKSARIRVHASPASYSAEEITPVCLTHVFVCRADIDPPLLIAHLPELVAACNAPSKARTPVLLIPLPIHAEHTLAEAVGLRRVSVLALDSTSPLLNTMSSLLATVQPPSAPWLNAPTVSHIPTHIKQLRTTAPRDMRAAKRARTEGRQCAKERRKVNESRDGHKNEKGQRSGTKRMSIIAPSSDLLPA